MQNQNNLYGSPQETFSYPTIYSLSTVDIMPIPTGYCTNAYTYSMAMYLCKLQSNEFIWFYSRDNGCHYLYIFVLE